MDIGNNLLCSAILGDDTFPLVFQYCMICSNTTSYTIIANIIQYAMNIVEGKILLADIIVGIITAADTISSRAALLRPFIFFGLDIVWIKSCGFMPAIKASICYMYM